jgi:hypothetical protein
VRHDVVEKHTIADVIRGSAKKFEGCPHRIIVGIPDDSARDAIKKKEDFIYIDHAYFKRGWHEGNFRAVRGEVHLTEIKPRPADRIKHLGVRIDPWRKNGREVIIIPPSDRQVALYDIPDWLIKTESRLCEITDRPVVVKNRKTTRLKDFCFDAWAVVTYASVAGVEAALLGIPVFSTTRCPSWPLNAGTLEQIETPQYSERRHDLACSLSYATWNVKDIYKVQWKNYDYSRRIDSPP